MQSREVWTRISVSQIEDLSDAVRGAGLEATQLSGGQLSGGLLFSETGGILCSSGLIGGRVSLYGPLSQDMITLGIGLRLEPGTRHWLNEVDTGGVGVFLPGDEHDSIYTPGSMYAAVTLSADQLEQEAANEDLVLDRKILGGTRVHVRSVALDSLAGLQRSFQCLHVGGGSRSHGAVGKQLLSAFISHLARPPHELGGRPPGYHAKIVERARAYIRERLCEPISIEEIAAAARTSRRTLFRAFQDIFDESPHQYVRRLRLHRIRHDLASEAERACTIALIANQWGMGDLGRMAGWYRELFGERPSETVASPPKFHSRLAQTT
jgi:AraC-like DNA-binding protein